MKVENEEKVVDRSDSTDDASDQNQFSNHHKDDLKMEDCGYHRPFEIMIDKTDTVETDRERSNEKRAGASVRHHESTHLDA